MVAAMITPGSPGRADDARFSTASVTIPAPALRCPPPGQSADRLGIALHTTIAARDHPWRDHVAAIAYCSPRPIISGRSLRSHSTDGALPMTRSYHVIDADGHVLEPFTLWNDYLDPAYRERAPKLVKDKNGKDRLLLEEQILGSTQGFGGIGGVGARQGVVKAEAMAYEDGRKGGFDPHARIPDMELDGIDAAFLYPSLGLFAGAVRDPGFAAAMCRAYNRWLADYCKPYPDRLFGIAMLNRRSG